MQNHFKKTNVWKILEISFCSFPKSVSRIFQTLVLCKLFFNIAENRDKMKKLYAVNE